MKKLLIIAAMLAAPALAAAKPPAEPKEITIAKALVIATLKDPDSAKFRGDKISGDVVCGEVNAKNSYGGYGGFKRYMVQDGVVIFDDEKYPLFDKWWSDECNK